MSYICSTCKLEVVKDIFNAEVPLCHNATMIWVACWNNHPANAARNAEMCQQNDPGLIHSIIDMGAYAQHKQFTTLWVNANVWIPAHGVDVFQPCRPECNYTFKEQSEFSLQTICIGPLRFYTAARSSKVVIVQGKSLNHQHMRCSVFNFINFLWVINTQIRTQAGVPAETIVSEQSSARSRCDRCCEEVTLWGAEV